MDNPIYAIITPGCSIVSIKIPYKGFDISISIDDGTLLNKVLLKRGDLLVFKDDKDVTSSFFNDRHDTYYPTLNMVCAVKKKIDKLVK